jgi:hypothetical protein
VFLTGTEPEHTCGAVEDTPPPEARAARVPAAAAPAAAASPVLPPAVVPLTPPPLGAEPTAPP